MSAVSPYTYEEQLQICEMLARHVQTRDIMKILASWGKPATSTIVHHYRSTPKWQAYINKFRALWAANILEVPLANQRLRLEYLQDMVRRLEHRPALTVSKQQARDRELRGILRQIADEMDPKKTEITNVHLTQYNQYTDEELLRRRQEVMDRILKFGVSGSSIRRLKDATRSGTEGSGAVAGNGGSVGGEPQGSAPDSGSGAEQSAQCPEERSRPDTEILEAGAESPTEVPPVSEAASSS